MRERRRSAPGTRNLARSLMPGRSRVMPFLIWLPFIIFSGLMSEPDEKPGRASSDTDVKGDASEF
jgi:hypothetical protein